jgi:acetolactate decarboxylase
MRKILFFNFLFLLLVGCHQNKISTPINIYGQLYKIMHEGQREGIISLPEVISSPHTYGLGAMKDLDGEILIMDNKVLINQANIGEIPTIQTEITNDDKALLLVTAQVENWQQMEINESVSMNSIDQVIKINAERLGIDSNKPFPFIIEGNFEMVNWHIISSPTEEGGHDAHLAGSWKRIDKQKIAKIFGFYSEHHKAVFTHHTTFTHMHVIYENESISGHIDDIEIFKPWLFSVPQ